MDVGLTLEIIGLIWEIIVGQLVLDLPKEDLVEINKMIKRNLERKKNAEVQEEDNPTDGL